MTNLSDRVRAGSEAAPWVIGAIKELEEEIERLKTEMRVVAQYVKPNWSNDMPWSDEIIIAIRGMVRSGCSK